MKRFLGIFLFLLFISNTTTLAATLPLNDNLNTNIMSTEETIKNEQDEKKQNKSKKTEPVVSSEFALNDKVLDLMVKAHKSVKPIGVVYSEAQKNIDAIDPQKNGNTNNSYPGLRGPNQLIVYTQDYGLRTGTNEFGTEAIVENNIVIGLNGADSAIPKNGFVISGHGNAKKWIEQNIQIGSKVYVDYMQNSLNVFLTPDGLLFAAKEKLKEVNSLVEYYRHLDVLYNDKLSTEQIMSAKNYVRRAEKKPEKTQQYISKAMELLNAAIENAIPYIENEMKGIWLRPVETSENEIQKTISKLSDAGITDIFLETYFHGKTIYPSDFIKQYSITSQREEFVGFDPLKIWIKEAHKKKMKIHIWFETFYVGNDNPKTTPNHVLNLYPSWGNKRLYNYNSEQPVPSLSEHNGYFLDPANTQVQNYLIGILNEIVIKYKPDGINLDYIRYPQTIEPRYSNYTLMNWGYTQNARNEFKSIYGIDPINIKYGTRQWENWTLYRQNKITGFVIKAKNIATEKNIKLTAVIFPDLNKCISTKMQNWRIWSYNNYVDGLTPLILTGDKNTTDILLKDITKHTKPETDIYPGIFVTFMGGTKDDLLLQIHKTRQHKTKGSVLFDYGHLNNDYIDALTTRVFNKSYDK